ncbi:MAG: PQQ-binding-like beta-propeller repeat protein [Prevotella sp.]|nr:PQQ-binding-like beta-propeller repeat protein [Prevotella sp.]
MRKFYSIMAMAAIAALCLTSCDDDDDAPKYYAVETTEGVFVTNGGNMSGKIDGSLTYYDYANGKASHNVYQAANGASLGGTVNDAVVYGSKIYIIGSDESTVFVADKKTLKKVANVAIKVKGEAATPRHAAAYDGKVYVTTFSNAVLAIDTLTNTIAETYECGSYSEGIAVSDGKLYVADSDYGKGNASISMIDLKTKTTTTFKHENIKNAVGIAVVNGRLFVQDSGSYDANYNQSGQGVYEIANGNVTKLADATEMAVDASHGKIYTINAPYTYPATPVSYGVIDTATGTVSKFCDGTEIEYPGKISVDPVKGNVFITSYVMGTGGYADYKAPGYCTIYKLDGTYQGKFDCNVGAGYVIPNTETKYLYK